MKFREWITAYLEAKSDKGSASLLSFLRKRFAKKDAKAMKRHSKQQMPIELPTDDVYPDQGWDDYEYDDHGDYDDYNYGGDMDDCDWDLQGEAITPGGRMFREWLKKRVTSEAMNAGAGGAPAVPQQNGAPMDPKQKMVNQTVSNVAGTLIKKNPQMVPGKTKPQDLAKAINDPVVSGQPDNVKQGVAQFLQGDPKNMK